MGELGLSFPLCALYPCAPPHTHVHTHVHARIHTHMHAHSTHAS